MTPDALEAEAIRLLFERALDAAPGDAREAVLASASDPALGEFVRRMLLADDEQGAIMPPERTGKLGGFELLEPIGAGAMGIVYRARQHSPARDAAIKLMRDPLVSRRMTARFLAESEALGRLRHPGIARVYSSGIDRASLTPFIAMELIEGEDIISFGQSARLSPRQAARLMADVADAVHHAHQRGVIHRDLKPSNILVEASGLPKVLDFGVSRIADGFANHTVTRPGERVGTLRYMSPEQASGEGEVDVRTDVYALGVIFCELASGRPAYQLPTSSTVAAIHAIASAVPTGALAITGPDADAARAICMRAMEKSVADRYESAAALRDDLVRLADDRPLLAARLPLRTRLARFLRRRRPQAVAATLASLVALVLAATAYTLVILRPAAAETRWTLARTQMLSPGLVDGIFEVVHWGPTWEAMGSPSVPPTIRLDDPDATLDLLEKAAALDPWNRQAALERDLLRYAIDLSRALRPVDAPDLLARDAPIVVEHGRGWTTARTPPVYDDASLADFDPPQLRSLGLFAYLTGDARTALQAMLAYERAQEPDALADAIAGFVYLVAGNPALAYPRLKRAHEVYPDNQAIRIYLADAASRVGDHFRARRLIDAAEDPGLGTIDRIRFGLAVAAMTSAQAAEHVAALPLESRNNPFLQARLLDHIAKVEGDAGAYAFWFSRVGKQGIWPSALQSPRSDRTLLWFQALRWTTLAEAWWASLNDADADRHLADLDLWLASDLPLDDAPDMPRHLVLFACAWRDLHLSQADPIVMVSDGAELNMARPRAEIETLLARWSDESRQPSHRTGSRPTLPALIADSIPTSASRLSVLRFPFRGSGFPATTDAWSGHTIDPTYKPIPDPNSPLWWINESN